MKDIIYRNGTLAVEATARDTIVANDRGVYQEPIHPASKPDLLPYEDVYLSRAWYRALLAEEEF